MTTPFRIYLGIFCGIILAGLTGVLLLNMLVDPNGAYPSLSLRQLEPYRTELTSRPAKAELAARGNFDVLLVGSSRLRVGMPVRHTAYGSARVCNLGLGATTLSETAAVLDFALRHNKVKTVLLGADFHLFSDSREVDPTFATSRFNPELEVFEYHCRNLLGSEATDSAWSLLRLRLKGKPPPQGENGFVPKFVPPKAAQRDLFARRVRSSLTTPGAEGSFRRSEQRLETFRQMVRTARTNQISLIVFIPPVHALQLEAIRVAGHALAFEEWKRDLTRILAEEGASKSVPLWDFTGYSGLVAEKVPAESDRSSRMKWYLEVSHFTPALGELVIQRMLGGDGSDGGNQNDFGVRLLPENIEEHLAGQRAARELYAKANPAEIAWLENIAATLDRGSSSAPGDF